MIATASPPLRSSRDALGRRVEKVVTGATYRYIYSGVETVSVYTSTGTWKQDYVYGEDIDEVVMLEQADLLDQDADSNTSELTRSFYHLNALGSVTEITDMSQAVAVSYRYDPYGQVTITRNSTTQTSDPLGQHVTYTGRWRDEETGLHHYRARAYDPARGRFLQRDPLGYTPAPSLYIAFSCAPTVYTDPMGEEDDRPDRLPGVLDILRAVNPAAGAAADAAGVTGEQVAAGAAGVANGAGDTPPIVDQLAEAAAEELGHGGIYRGGRDAGEIAAAVVNLVTLVRALPAILKSAPKLWKAVRGLLGRRRGAITAPGGGAPPAPPPAPPPRSAGAVTPSGAPVPAASPKGAAAPAVASPAPTPRPWPGNDPLKPPPGFEWRGRRGSCPPDRAGTYYNEATRETLWPDLNHGPPYGPHWDYWNPFDFKRYRIHPDGTHWLK